MPGMKLGLVINGLSIPQWQGCIEQYQQMQTKPILTLIELLPSLPTHFYQPPEVVEQDMKQEEILRVQLMYMADAIHLPVNTRIWHGPFAALLRQHDHWDPLLVTSTLRKTITSPFWLKQQNVMCVEAWLAGQMSSIANISQRDGDKICI